MRLALISSAVVSFRFDRSSPSLTPTMSLVRSYTVSYQPSDEERRHTHHVLKFFAAGRSERSDAGDGTTRRTAVATLDGIRVIDFGQYIAGPLAAVMLADQGAEVIHVDPPGGPRWKADADAFLQRGKRRLSLDLKSAGDREVAWRLIESADVVIENFRPGVMDRLGI